MKTWLAPSVAVLTLTTLSACGPVAIDPDQRGQVVPRTGKNDAAYSCQGNCGKKAAGGCWCDAACAQHGDCCADKSNVCDSRPGTCQGACGKKSPDGCWCDEQCATYGDCCADKAAVCSPTKKCTKNADCQSTELCELAKGDCLLPTLNISQGTCKPRPQGCYADCPGVCGCDGKFYCNACSAAAAGVSVAKDGSCSTTDPCAAMDAKGDGPCFLFLGWAWDGKSCVSLGGCTCVGKDCGKLYTDQAACTAAHASCTTPQCKDSKDCKEIACPLGGVVHETCVQGTCVSPSIKTCPGVECEKDPDCGPSNKSCVSYKCVTAACVDAHVNASDQCVGTGGGSCPIADCAKVCTDIDSKYKQAVVAAKTCNPFVTMPQCTYSAPSALICTCQTFVNTAPSSGDMAKYASDWKAHNCDSPALASYKACPPVPCPVVSGGTCDLSTKSCIDTPP